MSLANSAAFQTRTLWRGVWIYARLVDEDDPKPLPEPNSSVAPIKTYSLEEVADMIAPSDDPAATVRWLADQIRGGKASAYKVRRQWRMTHEDVEDLIGRNRNHTQAEGRSDSEQRRGQISEASRKLRVPTTDSPWLTAVEAAKRARVSEWTIREAVKQGELPASAVRRKSRQYRIHVSEVDDWMRSNSYEPWEQ